MAFSGRPVRWGILGCGNISRDFVSAACAMDAKESTIVACAARSAQSAAAFAEQFKASKVCESMRSYGGYGDLIQDPDVDVVYIGTLADTHEELCIQAIAAGKHVLVEKPIAMDAEGARRIYAAAREKGLFLMEGMWTRCFPAVRKLRELLKGGAIGNVATVAADFGFLAVPDPAGPAARLLNPKSGGVSMDIGMYPLSFVLLAAGGARPSRVVAAGATVGKPGEEVDWSVAASLSGFGEAGACPGLTASVLVTLHGETPEETVLVGDKGSIRLHGKAHTPTRLTLTTAAGRAESSVETFDFKLPPAAVGAALPWNYPCSEGLLYEAEAVVQALRQGLMECPDWTQNESVACMELVGELRRQVIAAAPAAS